MSRFIAAEQNLSGQITTGATSFVSIGCRLHELSHSPSELDKVDRTCASSLRSCIGYGNTRAIHTPSQYGVISFLAKGTGDEAN
jgi:hypothetical protein